MIQVLNTILNLFISVVNFIIDGLVGFLVFIISIPDMVNSANTFISVLPAFLQPYIIFGLFLTVIAMLIRREVF